MAGSSVIFAKITEAYGRDRRGAVRHALALEVRTVAEGAATDTIVRNLSETGFSIRTSVGLKIGEVIGVELPHGGGHSARIVWFRGEWVGCEFTIPVSSAALSAARLKNPFQIRDDPTSAPTHEVAPPIDYSDPAAGQPSQALLLLALVLGLVVASVFILALLTFPFSSS